MDDLAPERTWKNRLMGLFYPPVCVLCQGPVAGDRLLCRACVEELPVIEHGCRQCGRILPQTAGEVCGRCLHRRPPYDVVFAPFVYAPPLDQLVAEFKFRGRLTHATLFAQLLVTAAERKHMPPPAYLLPVPLHRSRLRERGYNQAIELARPLARHWNVRLDVNSVCRSRPTPAQMRLSARERLRNLRGAFEVRQGVRLPERVTIVDDVMTTGTTVGELTKTLHQAGVRRVEVWVLARAGWAHQPRSQK